MKLIYALIIVPLILSAIIVLQKIFIQQSIDTFSTLAICALLFLSLLAVFSLLLCRQKDWRAVENLWLSVVSSILTYMVVDLVAGYLFIKPLSPPLVPDQYVHHKMQPNTFSRFNTEDFDYIQRVNNIGLRGRDIALAKKDSIFRILILGDSFTMGKGVQDDETFAALLEESLKGRRMKVNGKTVEVVNAGVNSYAPILSFLQLSRELGHLRPDFVVLNLDMSDLIQEVAYRHAATYDANGEIVGVSGENPWTWRSVLDAPLPRENNRSNVRTPVPTVIRRWINYRLYVTRLFVLYLDTLFNESAQITIDNAVTLKNPELLKHTLAADELSRKKQWENIFDSILKIKGYCDANGIDFLLTVYPWGHQVNEKEWVPGRSGFVPDGSVVSDKSIRTIEDFALANKVDLLNVFPAFRAHNGGTALYFRHDMHWTTEGHKLMAQEFEKFLLAKYVKSP
jgi:GDSL-like Lipase/Acylhydrolase family